MNWKWSSKIYWLVGIIAVFLTLLSPAFPKFLSRYGLLLNGVIMHSILFSGFYLVACLVWRNPISQVFLVFLLSFAAEYLQQFTGRSFEWEDLAGNAIGIFAGFAAYQLYLQWPVRRAMVVAPQHAPTF
ncbi:VanZ family protein [Flavihumibacter rivuli]|uniref:VanZ family protein n=1 Tax=Flavihumibacter rivuli TaxID=2838156 RepID=UPI001BDE4004|nr:VanZ family protein [Flavihumibacter rivuli]ULQ56276.1 VanZ family protein [Flavihumibacter rivuli]